MIETVMKLTLQYRAYLDTNQKLEANYWLRVCRYWYNRQLGDRFDWWDNNRTYVNACPLVCALPSLREKPTRYGQQSQLPNLKTDLIKVVHSGELLDFTRLDSTVLQDVCKRVDDAFKRYVSGDCDRKRSGKPRFKNQASYRTMAFAMVKPKWIHLVRKNWLYIRLPKLGMIKVRMHRPIPDGAVLKRVSLTKKIDGWYINLIVEDSTVPEFTPDQIIPTWENSMGLDAVLRGDDYIATSQNTKYKSAKPLRKSLPKLKTVSAKKSSKRKGSKSRRKLAKRESRIHQRIARQRKDHRYNLAHQLIRTEKKVFFPENLNIKGLTKRNKPKQAADGTYLPNGQSAKSGINKSWLDAAFGEFLTTLDYIASKAGAVVIKQKPAYSSMILSYRNEVIFTDCSIREYYDSVERVLVDRDVNAAINLKRLGLGVFPSIKRRSGKLVISGDMDDSTTKQIVSILRDGTDTFASSFLAYGHAKGQKRRSPR
ncbi:transposase [Moorena sp. SIO4G3]|uniref:RNA-guided endonuclease InsQ/TnpB family protein n=1 Tax=Moorena sp. SIO4G3 TaxID=2607821 RepID=UPI0025CEC95B|nr:transposase [Moorena sp. SIO4G3]